MVDHLQDNTLVNTMSTIYARHTCMDADMGSKVEVERESFAAAFESALEWFLSRMNQLVSL